MCRFFNLIRWCLFCSAGLNIVNANASNNGISVNQKTISEVNIKQYGAKGNGKKDDYLAIYRALKSGFKNIYLPKGTYRITQELQLPSNVRLFGDGYSTIIKFERINKSGNHQSGYPIYGVDIHNSKIENIKIDCSATHTIIAAIRFEGAENVILNKVWLYKPYNGGILFGGPQFLNGTKVSKNCIAKNCKVTDMQAYNQSTGYACFIAAGGAKNCLFESCSVVSDIGDAYSADYAYDTKFIRCSFLGSAGGGFTAEGEQPGVSRNVYYENCTADLNGKGGTGWFLSENTNAVINNCTVKNISGKGVVAGMFLQNINTTINNCKFYNIKTLTGGYGGGALFAQNTGVVQVNQSVFRNNTFDLTNYNAGRNLVNLKFGSCIFYDLVNSYFASGKYDVEYTNCTFKGPVVHALQQVSSKASYEGCKFYSVFQQGTNGIDYILVSKCIFYSGTTSSSVNHTKTAIIVDKGSPPDALIIQNSKFYGFKTIISGMSAKEAKFKNCSFKNCLQTILHE